MRRGKQEVAVNRNYEDCPKCGSAISLSNFKRHTSKCDGTGTYRGKFKVRVDPTWQRPDGLYACPECSKMFSKMGISSHILFTHRHLQRNMSIRKEETPEERLKYGAKLKGITKEMNPNLGHSEETREKIRSISTGRKHSKETREKISKAVSQNHNGGYRKVPYYQYEKMDGTEVRLHGSLEVRFAKYLDGRGLEWTYEKPIEYVDEEGLIRHMLPDFWVESLGRYFDPKGYLTSDFDKKMKMVKEQKGIEILLLFQKDLQALENGKLELVDAG